jgi:hypothetical protein
MEGEGYVHMYIFERFERTRMSLISFVAIEQQQLV